MRSNQTLIILQTSPPRKLPALYVLDSIVKNVGTPYTIYLGRNLYSTFMGAYTLVDAQTRKNMEGMLKTWKEPVPGSIDPRPVFPPDVTRGIENALIQARTAAVKQQQQQARSQRIFLPQVRPTGTPPSDGWLNGAPSQTQPSFQYGPPPTPSNLVQQYPSYPLQNAPPSFQVCVS